MSGFGEPMGDDVSIVIRDSYMLSNADLYTWDVANYLSQDPIS